MRIAIPLIANTPLRQFFRGRCIAIMAAGVAGEISLTVFGASQQDAEDYGLVGAGFSLFSPDAYYTGVELTSPVDTSVEIVVSASNVQTTDGSRGNAPGNPLFVSGITLDDTPASSVHDNAPVAVGPVAGVIVAANANRLELRFTNNDTQAIALGAAGLTWANRTIVLQPGDTWLESKGAALAWYGITDAGGASSCNTQELLG